MADFKTTCRGPNCGAEIIMGTLPDGKPHPYNKPKRCARCKGKGTVPVVQGDLFAFVFAPSRDEPCRKCKGAKVMRASHFSTCPDAPRFRTARVYAEHQPTEGEKL